MVEQDSKISCLIQHDNSYILVSPKHWSYEMFKYSYGHASVLQDPIPWAMGFLFIWNCHHLNTRNLTEGNYRKIHGDSLTGESIHNQGWEKTSSDKR